jgi:hypothetical protein
MKSSGPLKKANTSFFVDILTPNGDISEYYEEIYRSVLKIKMDWVRLMWLSVEKIGIRWY